MATDHKPDTTETPPLAQLRHELGRYVGARARRAARRAGHRLGEAADRLLDVDEDSGTVPRVGSRVLHGQSPAEAIAAETGANLTSGVVGKLKDAVSGVGGESQGGGSEDGEEPSDDKATNIIEMIDVGVPLRTAYDHWIEYETFTGFAKGARDARRGDEAVSEWTVKVGPSTRTWKSTVQEQLPDDRIVWTSEGSTGTTQGAVSFHEITPTLTRIIMVLAYQPGGIVERTENLWGAQGRRARLDFENFQRFVTFSEEEVEGWRGEIREGEVVETHEEALAREEDEAQDEEYDDEEYEDGDEGGEKEAG